MKRILFLIVITAFFATLNACFAQQNELKIEDIKSIWVYCYFDSIGHTRGSIYRKFQELEDNNTPKILLDSVFVDSFKYTLVKSSKNKKLLPSKCGINLIFAQFVLNNNSTRNIIIASNGVFDYFIGGRGYFFIDSSDKQDKVIWMNNYFNTLVDKINSIAKE